MESLVNEIDKDEVRTLVEKRNKGFTLEQAVQEVNEVKEGLFKENETKG